MILAELQLETIGTVVAIIGGVATLFGILIHFERRYTRVEWRVDNIESDLSDLKPLKEILDALILVSKNPAIVNLAKHITPEKRNPYDPAEKNILLDKYQDGTINVVEAESLREMLNEDLELARDDAAGALAVGVLLVGIGTLIERLLKGKTVI